MRKKINIVCIGGGTGLSQLLSALKEEVNKKIKNLSALVTTFDSGGSTGILRKVYEIPAVGDIRNCLLALSNIENYIKKALQYRFKGKGLKNHPLGNLFLVALTETQGNLQKAVKIASKILKIKGEVIPITTENIHLGAIFENGKKIIGEDKIPEYALQKKVKIKNLFLYPSNPQPTTLAIKRIRAADFILIGPGSLYTSILPNFLIDKVVKEINESKAIKIFILNLLTQPGETDSFKASDHLGEFLRISNLKKIDLVLASKTKPKKIFLKKIKEENKEIVKIDRENLEKLGVKVIEKDLALIKDTYFKHSPKKLKRALETIFQKFML